MKKSYSMILIVLCLLACFIISACSNNAAKSANATPTTAPTTTPTTAPITVPTAVPTAAPTTAPTAAPTAASTVALTTAPTTESTVAPTINPTAAPTIAPTTASTVASTAEIGQGEQNNGTTAALPPPPPSVMITFKSLTNLEKFISAVNSQDTQFTEYAQIYALSEQKKYNAARKLADNYTAATVFGNKSDIRCDSSGGTYNADSNTLDLKCKINGINYRFIYSFGVDAPPQYEGEPVLRDVRVGHFAFDLYQGTGNRLVGAIMDGETEIRIVVMYAEQVSDIDFSAFTLFKLGDGSLSK